MAEVLLLVAITTLTVPSRFVEATEPTGDETLLDVGSLVPEEGTNSGGGGTP